MNSRHLTLTTACLALSLWSCQPSEDPANVPVSPTPAARPAAQTPSASAQPTAATTESETTGIEAVAELASMIPEDTFLWIELESFDAIVEAMDATVGDALQGAAPGASDPESALMLLQMMGLPTDRLLRDQPFGVALSLEIGVTEPKFSAMIPMRDAEETAAQINDMGGPANAMAMGGYVVFSNRTESDSDSEMAELYAGTRNDGLFGMRVDVARLMDRYGALLEAQMMAMNAAPKSRHAQEDPLTKGAEMGMDMVMAMAKGLKTMSLTVDIDSEELIVEGSAHLRSGSKLAQFGSDETVDLAALLRFVDFDEDEAIVGSLREDSLRFLADPVVALLDDMARRAGRDTMGTAYEQALGMILDGQVDFAVTASETDAAAFFMGLDSAQLVPLLERAMESHVSQLEDLTMMAPRKGQDESSRFAQYDLVANAGTPAVRHFKKAFGQPRLRVRMLGNLHQTMVTVGEGHTFARRTTEESGSMPADVSWALERAQGTNPVVISRTRLSGGLAERLATSFAAGMVPEVEGTERARNAWTTTYMAFGQTEWRMGMKVDLKAMSEQIQSAMESGVVLGQPR